MKYELYPWQKQCLDCWSAARYHGIVNVITGGGKTYLALAAADLLFSSCGSQPSLSGVRISDTLRVRIVVPTVSLVSQWMAAILDFFGSVFTREDIGCCCGRIKDIPDRKFMIYVINSARYCLARHIIEDMEKGRRIFLIADECHHYTSPENRKIFDFLPAVQSHPGLYASLGLSATLEKESDGCKNILFPALGNEIYHYGFSAAAKKQTICRYAIFQIALSFTPEECSVYEDLSFQISKALNTLLSREPSLKKLGRGQFFSKLQTLAGETASLAKIVLNLTYQRKAVTDNACARIRCVLKLISLLETDARIIVFGERIEQADSLYKILSKTLPNQAARYHSAMDGQTRKLALDRFRNGEIRILLSCRALDEGVDIPSANVGIVMSSSSIERQRVQRLGRILRRCQGKEISTLYYMYVAESAEEASFFPNAPEDTVLCNLSYNQEEDIFSNPEYAKAANAALQTFKRDNPDRMLIKEAMNCFRKGFLRPDWLLGADRCSEKIRSAVTTSERNYWICMRQIALSSIQNV